MEDTPPARTPRLLLVDGHYYLYRSFFAIRSLTNSRGEPTNAIYGFLKALRRMLTDVRPDYAAVVWDAGLPEHRTALHPDYKQNREEMPGDLEVQEEPLRDAIPLFGVTNVLLPGTEADDLIASYAAEARRQGISTIIATNDKDILQMVGEGISVYSSGTAAGGNGFRLLGVPEVIEKWGVEPHLIGDVLALTGDASDNIPGIPGVGEKTAAKWINRFGSLDGLLARASEDPKILEKLEPHRELVLRNRKMVELDLGLPLPVPVDSFTVAPRYSELIETLRTLEFRALGREVEADAASSGIPVTQQPSPSSSPGVGLQGELF